MAVLSPANALTPVPSASAHIKHPFIPTAAETSKTHHSSCEDEKALLMMSVFDFPMYSLVGGGLVVVVCRVLVYRLILVKVFGVFRYTVIHHNGHVHLDPRPRVLNANSLPHSPGEAQ